MSGQILTQGKAFLIQLARRNVAVHALGSSRPAPQNAPDLTVLWESTAGGVNGGTQVTPKRAQVEWLDDDQKLLIPEGLYRPEAEDLHDDYDLAMSTALSLAPNSAASLHTAHAALPRLQVVAAAEPGAVADAGDPSNWRAYLAPQDPAMRVMATVTYEITCGTMGGQNLDQFEPREAGFPDSTAFVTYHWGTGVDDKLVLAVALPEGTRDPTNLEEFYALEGAIEQVATAVSALNNMNYCVMDRGFIHRPGYTWNEDDDDDDASSATFVTRASQYSSAIIAALNLERLAGIEYLAWTRAYGVSMGMLPSLASKHNVEFQVTSHMPEAAELTKVVNAHGVGEIATEYHRACYSLLSMFGWLHMSNDHTWKDNDDALKRRARVAVQCLRTVVADDVLQAISSDGVIKHTVRTTCHPFGMASTWCAFQVGLKEGLLAEPLMDRKTTVPPTVARVGLVIGVFNKMLSLPLNELIKKRYKTQMDRISKLRTSVVENAAQYSNLHRYYGYDAQRQLSADDEEAVNALMPMVAAYANAFEHDVNGNPQGAALAQSIQNVIQQEPGTVQLYAEAFSKYAQKDHDIEQLISGRNAKAPQAEAQASQE